jgi:hypothetical protein
MSPLESFTKWLKLKIYQLEVTFSVYIFTPVEKFVFCTIPILLSSPLVSVLPLTITPLNRFGRLPSLQPDLHRDGPLPPAPHVLHRRPSLVLHARRRGRRC